MFTGIIEELGRVREIERRGEDARIVIAAGTVTAGSSEGDSISVNGVCLTARLVPLQLTFPKKLCCGRRWAA